MNNFISDTTSLQTQQQESVNWKKIQLVFILLLIAQCLLIGRCIRLSTEFYPPWEYAFNFISSLVRLAACFVMYTAVKGRGLIGTIIYIGIAVILMFWNVLPLLINIEVIRAGLGYNELYSFIRHMVYSFPLGILYFITLVLWTTYKPLKPIRTGLYFLLLMALPELFFYPVRIYSSGDLYNMLGSIMGIYYFFWTPVLIIIYACILYHITNSLKMEKEKII